MDPNAALMMILSGNFSACEGLREWILGGGFLPSHVHMLVDCDPKFGKLNKNHLYTCDNTGLVRVETAKLGTERRRTVMSWPELAAPRVAVRRVYLDSLGYACKRGAMPGYAGKYFGTGTKVWAAEDLSSGEVSFIRADSFDVAKRVARNCGVRRVFSQWFAYGDHV